mmetsp:Transcript_11898/g.28193  ORF Transcript_11898/g.28193 Transcript_11898/m.28193 type:complete len:336 (-) Transcript_11898:69-1076(-)
MSEAHRGDVKDINDRQRSELKLYEDKKQHLIQALSNAEHVAGNRSFDHRNDNRNHPSGSSLRKKLEQRWNDLILDTISNAPSTANTYHEDGCEDIADKCGNLPRPEISAFWFQSIFDRYTSSGRYYHTTVHLWEMFELLDIVIVSLGIREWYVPMAWSVFFHDSIYDPKSNRNEKDSAELFREFVSACMERGMDKVTFDNALTMILATEKHKVILISRDTSKDFAKAVMEMQEHFLDIDMAVLGKNKDAYYGYAALIRKEYEFVPHDVYCSKRAEILETFLIGDNTTAGADDSSNPSIETKYIYLSESFRSVFEKRAKANLRDEIELLRANTIPK